MSLGLVLAELVVHALVNKLTAVKAIELVIVTVNN